MKKPLTLTQQLLLAFVGLWLLPLSLFLLLGASLGLAVGFASLCTLSGALSAAFHLLTS